MRKLLCIVLCCASMFAAAQEKKMLTPADAAYQNRAVYPQRKAVQWQGNSDNYVYTANDGKSLLSQKVGAKSATTLITLDRINEYSKMAGYSEMNRIPSLNWMSESTAYYYRMVEEQNIGVFVLDIKEGKVEQLTTIPSVAENITFCAASLRVAYTIDNNLFVADRNGNRQLTTNPEGVVAGQSVHRNEFAIDGGIFWSPNGKKLAYYFMDQTMVTDYPLVDVTTRIATLKNEKYPMAGMTSHEVTLMIYDCDSQKTIAVQTGEPKEQYLTAVTWNNDSKKIYIGILNRGQNHLMFNEYSAKDGKFDHTIFEDRDEQYVEPVGPAHFVPGSTTQFIWCAQRDGYYHLYLHNVKGGEPKQLTKGNFVVTEFNGFDDAGDFYFTSTEVSPLERHLYKQNLKSGKRTKLTVAHGTHSGLLSASGKHFIDFYSSTDVPYNIDINTNGKKACSFWQAEDPLAEYNLGETTIGQLQSEDGQTLYTRLIKPYNFDPNRKYPVIVYVYGGPHAQLITDSWLADAGIYLNYLAQEGFVVWTLDNRGSADRGEAFEQVIHRQCGQAEMRDQMIGIEYLKTLPFVDSERIGVDGWSYGGFMTTTLKLNHPEVFKVAVAGGPVIDWKYYEIMYGERYMDTPEENPDGYELTSLINQVDKLEGKLMIIHCTTDPTVVWQHSLSFVQACIEHGKLLDYFVYPGHDHNVMGPDRTHLIMKISQYFKENL